MHAEKETQTRRDDVDWTLKRGSEHQPPKAGATTEGKGSSEKSAAGKAKAKAAGTEKDTAKGTAKGTAKERVGGATGDESLQAEGKGEKAKGDLKQAGEKVKDAFKS